MLSTHPKQDKASERRREWDKEHRAERVGKPLVEVILPETAAELEKEWNRITEADPLTDKKTQKVFTLESPIVIGDEFKDMVAREFRRVAYTGTMKYSLQIVRPAHEVALGIWLARLEVKGDVGNVKSGERGTGNGEREERALTQEQKNRLAQLDALLAEELSSPRTSTTQSEKKYWVETYPNTASFLFYLTLSPL